MRLKEWIPRHTVLILFMLLITACGTSEPVPTPNPPTTTPVLPTATQIVPTVTPTPNPPTETPLPPVAITSIEDLVGIWGRGDLRQLFRDDGVFISSEIGAWSCRGQFWFEGNQLHIRDTTEYCSTREVGIYEVQGVPQDYLTITPVSDYSSSRKSHFRGTWHWVGSP
jgi:hypothetical protein